MTKLAYFRISLLTICSLSAVGIASCNPIFNPFDIPATVPELKFVHFLVLAFINYGFDLLVLLFVLDWFGLLGEMTAAYVLKYNLWVTIGGWLADIFGYWSVKNVGINSEIFVGIRFIGGMTLIAGWVILIWNLLLARLVLDMDFQEASAVGIIFAIFTSPWSLLIVAALLSDLEFLPGIIIFFLLTALGTYKLVCKTFLVSEMSKKRIFRSRLLIASGITFYWLSVLVLSAVMWNWLTSLPLPPSMKGGWE